MAKIKYLEVASCKLHIMPWFWMNVLSFPLTSLVWLECSSKLVRYIIALCIGIYVVFLQFCYAKLRRLRLNCNCTVTDSETIWRKQLLCCFQNWVRIFSEFLHTITLVQTELWENYVPQCWVGCLLNDSELFILFAENSQILLKISVIPILLTFMYLVALNLLVNNQLNSLLNSTHHCARN